MMGGLSGALIVAYFMLYNGIVDHGGVCRKSIPDLFASTTQTYQQYYSSLYVSVSMYLTLFYFRLAQCIIFNSWLASCNVVITFQEKVYKFQSRQNKDFKWMFKTVFQHF